MRTVQSQSPATAGTESRESSWQTWLAFRAFQWRWVILAFVVGLVSGNAFQNIHALEGQRAYFVRKYCPDQVTKAIATTPLKVTPQRGY